MGKKGNKRKTRWRVLSLPIGNAAVAEGAGAGDDYSDDEDTRSGRGSGRGMGRGAGRNFERRGRFQRAQSPAQEKRIFNEDEYTRITTPRQDVLFKKGYLGRKKLPEHQDQGDQSNYQCNGNGVLNGDVLDGVDCGDQCPDDQTGYYYPGAYMDPNGMYYMNGCSGYELYDPYSGAVTQLTVVVAPGGAPGAPGGPGTLVPLGAPVPMPLPHMDWFNPRLHPGAHTPGPQDYCYMHGRKRYSVDSQACSGPGSESSGSVSNPPSSPQESDASATTGTQGAMSPGSPLVPPPPPPPQMAPSGPPISPMAFSPHYVYPHYVYGAPMYGMDGVTGVPGIPGVTGIPGAQFVTSCDLNAARTRKKKRRRKRKRGGVADDGECSEESSSSDKEVEDGVNGEGSASSLSSQSASAQATPTDSDAFTEFVAKHSTLNGDARAWEPVSQTSESTPDEDIATPTDQITDGPPEEASPVQASSIQPEESTDQCTQDAVTISELDALSLRPEMPKTGPTSNTSAELKGVDDLFLAALVGKLAEAQAVSDQPSLPNDFAQQEVTQNSTDAQSQEPAQPDKLDQCENAVQIEPPIESTCQEDVLHLTQQIQTIEISKSESNAPVTCLPSSPVESVIEVKENNSKVTNKSQGNGNSGSGHPSRRSKKKAAKERAPTPGRELTLATKTQRISGTSDTANLDEVVEPPVQPTTSSIPCASPSSQDPDPVLVPVDTSQSPPAKPAEPSVPPDLRITAAVTAWLKDRDLPQVLPVPTALSDLSDSDESEDDTNTNTQTKSTGPKNGVGNPFLALFRSASFGGSRRHREGRVAANATEAALTSSAPVDIDPDVGDDPLCIQSPLQTPLWPEQHDSGVHSDESGDERNGRADSSRTKKAELPAELLAAKSALLLKELKGSPVGSPFGPFPCGGLCCTLM